MFWNLLRPAQEELLKKLVADPPVKSCYLAGGTGLALLLGHRESIDFDWFTPVEFQPAEIEERLESIGSYMVMKSKVGTLYVLLNEVRVTWLHYPNPLLKPFIRTPLLPGLVIASLTDIGVMKWIAISQRGARKDFVDLYFILKEGLTLTTLMNLLPTKFPKREINYYHLVRRLGYFEDAERQWVLN